MHAEMFYSMGWSINLKDNNNQYYSDKHLRSVLNDSITGREINDNIYLYCSVAVDHGLGCSQSPWMCTLLQLLFLLLLAADPAVAPAGPVVANCWFYFRR